MEQLPLFVFATLRRGECNHHLLEDRYDGMTSAVLKNFVRVAPLMIERSPGNTVDGELYFLRLDAYTDTIAACDELEGVPKGGTAGPHYERVRVAVEVENEAVAAWAYVRPESDSQQNKAGTN